MGVLTSNLFTSGDASTVKKLEDCATGKPSEVQSHFTLNQTGDHITKVQEARKSVQEANPGIGIPAISVNGVYDQTFAEAIRVYRAKRDIRNFASKIDNVVGVNTIRSLDRDSKSGPPKVNPTPTPKPKTPGEVPRALPNCVPDSDCPTSSEFDVTLVAGGSAGEIVEAGKFFFAIRDTSSGLSAAYVLRVGGLGFGPSVGGSGFGGKKHFTTSKDVQIIRFGPLGSMGGATSIPGNPLNFALLVLGFRPDGETLRLTLPMTIDTGPIEIPGASIHVGQMKILSLCGEQPGATRRILDIRDFPI